MGSDEPTIDPVSGEAGVFDMYGLPTEALIRSGQWRHQLLDDHEDKLLVEYRPLEKVNESDWLIDVNGRVYCVREEILVAGLEMMNDVNP